MECLRSVYRSCEVQPAVASTIVPVTVMHFCFAISLWGCIRDSRGCHRNPLIRQRELWAHLESLGPVVYPPVIRPSGT